jgi:hypothetical protein
MPTPAKTAATVFNCIFMPLAIMGDWQEMRSQELEPTANRVGSTCERPVHPHLNLFVSIRLHFAVPFAAISVFHQSPITFHLSLFASLRPCLVARRVRAASPLAKYFLQSPLTRLSL